MRETDASNGLSWTTGRTLYLERMGDSLTLSRRSSTILFNGPGFPNTLERCEVDGVCDPLKGTLVLSTSPGVPGAESPSTAVVGRKSVAMTARWFLRELIVLRDCARGRGLVADEEE